MSIDKTIGYENSDAQKTTRTERPALLEQVGRFPERLEIAMGGASVRGFSAHLRVSEGTLRSYLRGDTFPDLSVLADIAIAADVSLAWLATGEGSMRGVTQETFGPVDISVLERILLRIGEIESEENTDWEPHLKAKLIAAVYDYVMEEDVPEADRTKQIGKVIAFIRKVG